MKNFIMFKSINFAESNSVSFSSSFYYSDSYNYLLFFTNFYIFYGTIKVKKRERREFRDKEDIIIQ